MKKILLFLLTGIITCCILASCNTTNQLVSRQTLENRVLAEINQKGSSPDVLPGKCPYPCTDPRCKAYHNGYCGPAPVIVITNPNNPYDYSGADHNNGVVTLLMEISGQPTVSEIIQDTKDYGSSINMDTSYYNGWYDTATMYHYYYIENNVYAEDPNALDTLLFDDGAINTTDLNYLNSMNNAIDNVITDGTAPTEALYQKIADQILNIENNIINDNTLTTSEKMGLLQTASIIRYSGAYWANYINSNTNNANNANNAEPYCFLCHFTWRGLWHADASGAVGGGISAIIVKGLAQFTWSGVPVGAILGAIGSSVGYLFFGS